MGKGEYHMEVRGVDHLGPACIDPEFFLDGLTVGAIPVFTGIGVDLGMSAFLALAHTVSESPGLAAHYGVGRFLLDTGRLERSGEVLPAMRKNLLDVGVSHGQSLPSGQTGLRHGTSHFVQDGRKSW